MCEAAGTITESQQRIYSMKVACRKCGTEVLGTDAAGLYVNEKLCRKCYRLRASDFERHANGHLLNSHCVRCAYVVFFVAIETIPSYLTGLIHTLPQEWLPPREWLAIYEAVAKSANGAAARLMSAMEIPRGIECRHKGFRTEILDDEDGDNGDIEEEEFRIPRVPHAK